MTSNISRRAFLGTAAGASALGLSGIRSAHAAFPERGLTVVVPYSAGGGSDVSARLLAKAILTGDVRRYEQMVEDTLYPELSAASRLADRYYESRYVGLSSLFLTKSPAARGVAAEFFQDRLHYGEAKSTLKKHLARVVWEILTSPLGRK